MLLLADQILISEILPWDRKSYFTHVIFTRRKGPRAVHWLYWNSLTWSSSDVIVMLKWLYHNWPSSRENLSSGVCEQNRRRPACASPQSDQRLCYSLLENFICKLATGEISILYLVSVAGKTGLSLALSETPKIGFVATRLISCRTSASVSIFEH